MEGLSKNQIKKAAKRERINEKYQDRKLQRKAQVEQNATLREPQDSNPLSGPLRKERNAMFKADYDARCAQGPTIVIDCEWSEKMTERELLSLTQQIMYCYAANKRAAKPARLCILGASDAHTSLIRKLPGFDTWDVHVSTCTLDQINLPSSALYLTADTDTTLNVNSIGPKNVLIIGGIVDRNRHKRATLVKAEALGLGTAQLPIGEMMPLKSSRVLAVNHVFEILVNVMGHGDWKRALDDVIPDRKKNSQIDTT